MRTFMLIVLALAGCTHEVPSPPIAPVTVAASPPPRTLWLRGRLEGRFTVEEGAFETCEVSYGGGFTGETLRCYARACVLEHGQLHNGPDGCQETLRIDTTYEEDPGSPDDPRWGCEGAPPAAGRCDDEEDALCTAWSVPVVEPQPSCIRFECRVHLDQRHDLAWATAQCRGVQDSLRVVQSMSRERRR